MRPWSAEFGEKSEGKGRRTTPPCRRSCVSSSPLVPNPGRAVRELPGVEKADPRTSRGSAAGASAAQFHGFSAPGDHVDIAAGLAASTSIPQRSSRPCALRVMKGRLSRGLGPCDRSIQAARIRWNTATRRLHAVHGSGGPAPTVCRASPSYKGEGSLRSSTTICSLIHRHIFTRSPIVVRD